MNQNSLPPDFQTPTGLGAGSGLELGQPTPAPAQELPPEDDNRLGLVLEAAHAGFYDLDLLTGESRFTPECATMLGYDPVDFRLDVARWSSWLHPEDREAALAILSSCGRGELSGYNCEFRLRSRTGEWKWIQSCGKVSAWGPDGRPARLIGIHIDITERKNVEEALRRTEYFLTKSQEVARLGSYAFDIAHGIWNSTRVLDEIFGIEADYPKTVESWLDLVVPEEREGMRKHLLEHVVALHNRFDREYRIVRNRDRQERWVHGQGELEFDQQGRPVRMIGTILDITERKNAERLRREAEGMYRTIFQTSPDGITLLDLEARITFVSPKALQVIGAATPEEVTGRPVDDFIEPHDHERVHAAFRRVLNEQYLTSSEYTVRRPDGSSFIAEFNAALLRGVDGRPKGVLVIMRDTTARKRAEAALRSSERKLAEIFRASPEFISVSTLADGRMIEINDAAVRLLGFQREEVIGRTSLEIGMWPTSAERKRMVDLVREQGQVRNVETRLQTKSGGIVDVLMSMAPVTVDGQSCLVTVAADISERKRVEKARMEMERRLLHAQKLESLGVLAGGIAHDFNNLLMAILGNLDLALMDLSPVSPARACIEQSAMAARRAADLTRQMLAYSGKANFDIRRINLSELVEENAHLFRACISKIVVLNVWLDRSLPPINADTGQLQQVIMNLITNASEAIGDRPGAISLSTGVESYDTPALSRSRVGDLPPPGRFVWLEVTDTGCGMDQETQLRLFDPFFSTKLMGRGLGMSAILGIVRAHQGAIFVDSAVGKGTTIRVLFPAGETPPQKQGTDAASGNLHSQPGEQRPREGTVLLVDDEAMVRNVCTQILKRLGWRVIAAADGPEAIELYQKSPASIDCVILDQSMPQMDGTEVFRALRAINPEAKVILSSGYSNDQTTGQGLTAEGLAGFIQKPYTVDGLRRELERILKGAE